MSRVEQVFCRSAPWRVVAARVVLPWVLQGHETRGAVLELGAGSGTMAAATAIRWPHAHVTATDVDPAMVEVMRRRLRKQANTAVQRADVTALPFADGAFDVVASHLMLHHVVRWQEALSEASRVLRPGGLFIGYDLTRSRVAELLHWADRSPHELFEPASLESALARVALQPTTVDLALHGHVVRFAARKAHSEGEHEAPEP